MVHIILILVCLAGLLVGTVTDIKRREVPDWVNYGLIFAGIGINLILTIVEKDWRYIVFSLIGLLVFYIIALIMFYSAQWGGGDSKMLMGLGALLGMEIMLPITGTLKNWIIDPFHNLPFIFYFIVFAMLFGSIYGIVWSIVVSIKNWKNFKNDFKKRLSEKKIVIAKWAIIASLVFAFVFAAFTKDPIIRIGILAFGVIVVFSFYLYLYIKSVEKVCMQKYVIPQQLTEGDWIVDDIKTTAGGKVIAGPKDLGVSKEQIKELIGLYKKGKIKKVLIKEGIPFVPAFLAGFVIALIYIKLF